MKKDIKILAIETSCDETATAIIGVEKNRPVILSNIISSQIDLHAKTGGVVPEVASRAHMESIIPVIIEALKEARRRQNPKSEILNPKQIINSKNQNSKQISDFDICASDLLQDVTHLAVTAGPGLIGSLLVGFNAAKSLAYALDVPIIPVNHIEGHIYSAFSREISKSEFLISNQIPNPKSQEARSFPILALTVSGGHTSLTLMKDHGKYQSIGSTRDDAAGEAFDKVAKLLGLGYPGGPIVSKLAAKYRETQNSSLISQNIILPRPMIKEPNFDFSFSGLKTAVLEVVKNLRTEELKNRKSEICAAFEDAVVDVLVTKTLRAAEKYQPKAIILAGGVAANKRLREELESRLLNLKSEIRNPKQIQNSKSEKANKLIPNSYNLLLPPAELCGDNAAMIGLAAYYHILRGDTKKWNQIKIDSNLKI